MKAILISDTHGRQAYIPNQWVENKDNSIDTILHGGDVSNIGKLDDIESFFAWYNSLNYKNKIFIAGNHDWGFQRDPKTIREILRKYPDITYLQDSSITINGIKIYGSPHQPYFYDWAFNLQRGPQLKAMWDKIDLDTDILISHGPAADTGYLDLCPDGFHAGCVDLKEAIDRIKPKLHLCGHIHDGYGVYETPDTLFINASTLNERYEVAHKPIIIEIDENKKVTILSDN